MKNWLACLNITRNNFFNLLRFRTDRTVKHIEVLLDETTQKYRVKDESDAVSYANFLQFDSIQQLLDQCKQHASKEGTVLDYDLQIEIDQKTEKPNEAAVYFFNGMLTHSSC